MRFVEIKEGEERFFCFFLFFLFFLFFVFFLFFLLEYYIFF